MLICMCMLNKRTQILFENEFWNQLLALAKTKDTSVGELVRRAVRETYFQEDKKQKMARAMERIAKIRKTLKKVTYKEIKEMINYGRKY